MKCFVFFTAIVALCSYNVFAASTNNRYIETEEITLLGNKLPDVKKLEQDAFENLQIASDNNAYWLYTRKNPITPQIIVHGDLVSLFTSNYNSSQSLKVIVHGWTGNGNHLLNTMVTAAFLEISDVNVIVLDWSIDASGHYLNACVKVPSVGRFLGNFLQWLINTGGGNWDNVHLIGHSLGAHVVGNTGRHVGGQPRRVTGLDPAGPLWSQNLYALNTYSGKYVEAIHTNILSRGISEPIAHVDFYPNGGRMQPGCDTDHCSHERVYEFFASSVRTDHFVGRKCSNFWLAIFNKCIGATLNMGNGIINKSGDGIYALTTSDSWPF